MISHIHPRPSSIHVRTTDHGVIAWPAPGLHTGIPFDVYRSCDIKPADTWESAKGKSVSKSLICDFIKDAAKWRNSPPKETTSAMSAGSLLDCLLTSPEEFHVRYVISQYAEFRTNEAKAWRAEMEEAGKVVLKEDQFDVAQAQLSAIRNKPEAAKLLDGAQFQVAFRHKTKHPFGSKGLIDILPDDGETIVDLKTCESRALDSPHALKSHIYKWMYDIQSGAYCQGYAMASGDERTQFKFIFVSSAPPYTVAVVSLPLSDILAGADIYTAGVNRFAECLESNSWPSMWDGEVELSMPSYDRFGGSEE